MPELPEIEILVRHLQPLLKGRTIRRVRIGRLKCLRGTSPAAFRRLVTGARFVVLSRRGKYLLFTLQRRGERQRLMLIGHLGMTGRMYLSPLGAALPKHVVVALEFDRDRFVFEDLRYFGSFTFNSSAIDALGPEPLSAGFTVKCFSKSLERSRQAIKVKLLDQSLVAGIGNIYASETLFRAGLSPQLPANRLKPAQVERLWRAIRATLTEAIRCGSTLSLHFAGTGSQDGLFYFGRAPGASESYEERLQVYDREGEPCRVCHTAIRRVTQAARSTYYCPQCQQD